MAASGFTPIQLYRTSTASASPTAGNLSDGELAINTNDGKLFYKDSGGVVQTLASKATGSIGGTNTQVQYNSSGSLAGSANLTFNGTTLTANTLALTNALTVANGGTGLATTTAYGLIAAGTTATGAFQQVSGTGTAGQVLTSNGAGALPTWQASTGGVTSFSAGTTGFTPSTATTGAITLAGTLAVANGGTGQTTYTNGQLLIGNTTGNTLTKATLTAGSGISITNGTGSITIAASGGGGSAAAGNIFLQTNFGGF